jgi:hypothetical protein
MINEMNISGDKFKQYIKSKVPLSSIILRSKNANSAFDIKGLKMKEIFENNSSEIKEEKIELDINENVLKKKMVVKKFKN